jgi:hypothetical protein
VACSHQIHLLLLLSLECLLHHCLSWECSLHILLLLLLLVRQPSGAAEV